MAELHLEKYRVPHGLRPLLEAFARESLRAQPTDLISFGKLFFDLLHHHSQEAKNVIEDPVQYNKFKTELQHKVKCETGHFRSLSPKDIAATKIQSAFRGFQVRHHPEQFGIPLETMTRRRSAERLASLDTKKDVKRHSVGGYSMESVDTPEDRAATRIQAEIRGFLTRKQVQHMKEESMNAATKIQAHIRGFLTRKHLDEQGLLSPSRSRSSIHSSRSDDLDAH
uniref:RIIa domain-containing protein n=1 Tax=Steinernema glaseri TaxID=37863 RepID=A0A1I8AMD5_9BILA